nr:MAG TPA: restriction alleviation protein [Caudoviricetes sp.]
MTDKLYCPFCGAELQEFGGGDFPLVHYCDNINCNLYHIMGQHTLLQELIRTRKALGIAVDVLTRITVSPETMMEPEKVVPQLADLALEQITALEQKDVK